MAYVLNLAAATRNRKLRLHLTCPLRTFPFIPTISRELPVRLHPAPLLGLLFASALSAQRVKPADLAVYLGHGVSHSLAIWRAKTVRDVHYDLSLDVTAPDSAVGHVVVRFTRTGESDAILDWRGRRLTRMTVNGKALPRSAANGAHIRVPARLLKPKMNSLELWFVSDIAPSGASIIRTHDQNDGSDYLYTLLVPADANQLFPCFDQPDLKARVTFTLVTPRAWTALANGSIAHADTTAGTITRHFTETRPLSTYLIAFAAGPWQRTTSVANGRAISVYIRKSRAKEADADTLLALTHRAIGWMEQYFGRPYPFEKFDLLLAPAFPFGGMEHPGVVMFNEDRFIFRERPTLPRRLGRFSTILHEVAHQWFGDLVTMRWFDDLWLKEGFATYMAAKGLADLEPSSDAWKSFYQSNKPLAYGVDQTTGTTPLWQALSNLDQAKSAYGAIVYNKAPSVLMQLNYLVGERAFRAGVHQFLSDHAYANATWQDLLGSIGKAWGRPLDAFGRNFMLRPGMPEVQQQLTVRDGKIVKLELAQKPAQALSGPGAWPMRTQLLLAYDGARADTTIPVSLSADITDVTSARGKPAPAFVFANAGDYGYFITLTDSVSTQWMLSGGIGRVHDGLLRTMLWGALWDQVREAQLPPERFTALALAELSHETDEQIVPVLLGRIERATRAYIAPERAAGVTAIAEHTLWAGIRDSSKSYGVRKAFLDAFIGLASTPDGVAKLESLLTEKATAGEPVGDPTRWAVVNRLIVLGAPNAQSALVAQITKDTTPDGRRRAFVAGAARGTPAAKAEYFKRYFADKSLNEDWASGSLGEFNALEQQAITLPYLRPALDSLPFIQANRRIFFLGGWLGAFIGGQTSDAALHTVKKYLADHPNLPKDLRGKVLQSADELERTVRIRKRWP
ncbi:MAG TPA: M1 family aminopeptidase [Gemmatimonadaceae bacterium]